MDARQPAHVVFSPDSTHVFSVPFCVRAHCVRSASADGIEEIAHKRITPSLMRVFPTELRVRTTSHARACSKGLRPVYTKYCWPKCAYKFSRTIMCPFSQGTQAPPPREFVRGSPGKHHRRCEGQARECGRGPASRGCSCWVGCPQAGLVYCCARYG